MSIAVTGIVEKVLGIADKLLDHIPDYDQRKKDQYFKFKQIYKNEKNKANQDMNFMLDLLDLINDVFDTYYKEINK